MTKNTKLDGDGRLVLGGWVTSLDRGEIFVVGSNARGMHGGGAARIAMDHFGAVYGQGHGLHGESYAIDTMTDEQTMAAEIAAFLDFARAHGELTFLVTEIGCGIGSYRPRDVAPYFADSPSNVALPESFAEVLRASGRSAPSSLSAAQLDRAVGAVVVSAAGDALGSQYEFGPSHPDAFTPEFGVGPFGHGVGEWTDDTAMAIPILEALARGDSLRDAAALGRIVGEWDKWSRDAKDVGAQTRAVLASLRGVHSEDAARAAARAHHERSGRSGGNGSLMRTGPVALGYLAPGREKRSAEAAGRIAQLTHWEQDNADAAIIWSAMIRHAILTGELDLYVWTPLFGDATPRNHKWATIIDVALSGHPRDFADQNGWVVRAFQAALCAVHGASNAREALFRAIQGGGDTDTVAAIAGSLAGALWGAEQVPLSWQRQLHGWPGYRVSDLTRLAILAARRGVPDGRG